MKKNLYFILCFMCPVFFYLIIFGWHPCRAQYTNWESFSTAHGLGDVEVYTIFESPSTGDLWFGTRNGATRYDGTWKNLDLDNDNSHGNRVHAIAEDDVGNIWLGTGKGVKIYRDWKKMPTPEILANDSILVIKKDDSGKLWFGTPNGAFSYDPLDKTWPLDSTWNHYYMNEDSSLNNTIWALEFVDSFVWFGTTHGYIYRFNVNHNQWSSYKIEKTNKITDLFKDNRDTLWAATEGNQAHSFDGEKWNIFGKDRLNANVFAITQDWDGDFWFATKDSGVMHFDSTSGWVTYNFERGFPTNHVLDVLEDSYRNIWAATKFSGVSRYDGSWRTFLRSSSIWDKINAMEKDNSGKIWFGLSGNGIRKYDGRRFEPISPGGTINAIEQGHDLTIWFGTSGEGIKIYDGKELIPFPSPLDHSTILSIFEDSNKNLWFGTIDKGVTRYVREDTTSWTTFTIDSQLVHNNVNAIYEDHNGLLWFATDNGISYFDGKMKSINKDSIKLISNKFFTSIAEDHEGVLWFGTTDSGVIKYDRSNWESVKTGQGLANNNIHSIIFDPNNNKLWFGTEGGVSSLIRDKNKDQWIPPYNRHTTALTSNYVLSILLDLKINKAAGDTASTLWFGTAKGAARYLGEAFPPETHILTANDSTFNTDRPVFDVSARDNISSRYEISYSYQIWQIDDVGTKKLLFDWSDFSFDTRIIAPSLRNGQYEIFVRARDSDGNIDPTPDKRQFKVNQYLIQDINPFDREITASVGNKSVTVYIHPKAFDETIGIKITNLDSSEISGSEMQLDTFYVGYNILAIDAESQEIVPATLKKEKVGWISIKDPAIVQNNQEQNPLTIYYIPPAKDTSWVLGGTVDFTKNTITAPFESFGKYAVGIGIRLETESIITELNCRPRVFSTNGNGLTGYTNILFTLGKTTPVTIKVYNVAGRLIRNFTTQQLFPGENSITWNGANDEGNKCVSGLYIICALVGSEKKFKTVAIVNN